MILRNPQAFNDPKGISIGSMGFDNPKFYCDISIFDGLVFDGGTKQGPKFQAGLDQCIWILGNHVLRLTCLLTGVNVEQLTLIPLITVCKTNPYQLTDSD